MTRTSLRQTLLVASVSILPVAPVFLPCLASPAAAQVTVYDPANHSQNLLTAARTLQQINNQITQLQNEAQMLVHQARNLASLPYSSLAQLQATLERTQGLLDEAQRLAFDVAAIETAFSERYGDAAGTGDIDARMAGAQERWRDSVAGFEDALKVQAGVVGNLDGARAEMAALLARSQAATGALQATQAGNQLLALQTAQIADLTAAIAAQNRAQSLEAARAASAEAQARENIARFLDSGPGYRPSTVRLFQE